MTQIELFADSISAKFTELIQEIKTSPTGNATKLEGQTLQEIESRIIRKVILIGLTFFLFQIGMLAIYQIFFNDMQ